MESRFLVVSLTLVYIFSTMRKNALAQGTGPYFYLPKLESHLEARLWNDVFVFAQDYIGIPQGTIKATVLIETILAAFEMDEILYELREHSAGLNCGRWDYIFSYIKRLRNQPDVILPDRGQVTMTVTIYACLFVIYVSKHVTNAMHLRWVVWQRKFRLKVMTKQML